MSKPILVMQEMNTKSSEEANKKASEEVNGQTIEKQYGVEPYVVQKPKDTEKCRIEFSIEADLAQEIDIIFEKIQKANPGYLLRKPSEFHITMLYGFAESQSPKVMKIIRQAWKEASKLKTAAIKFGDEAPVVLLKLEVPEALRKLYTIVKTYTKNPQGGAYDGFVDPHITIAKLDDDNEKFATSGYKEKSQKERREKWIKEVNIEDAKKIVADKMASGRTVTVSEAISVFKNAQGVHQILDRYSVAPQATKNAAIGTISAAAPAADVTATVVSISKPKN